MGEWATPTLSYIRLYNVYRIPRYQINNCYGILHTLATHPVTILLAVIFTPLTLDGHALLAPAFNAFFTNRLTIANDTIDFKNEALANLAARFTVLAKVFRPGRKSVLHHIERLVVVRLILKLIVTSTARVNAGHCVIVS